MHMVVEHKHKIGFKGDLLIEPKPQEPTKHQYDYDSATVFGFLHEYGLEHEIKVNIEANHATLAGHSYHEIATAVSLGIFGIDANRGDPQNGWDTDQFPNSVEEMTSRRMKSSRPAVSRMAATTSIPRCAARAWTRSTCSTATSPPWMCSPWRWNARRRWCRTIGCSSSRTSAMPAGSKPLGQAVLAGEFSLESLAEHAFAHELNPQAVSGRQEMLEGIVNRFIYLITQPSA